MTPGAESTDRGFASNLKNHKGLVAGLGLAAAAVATVAVVGGGALLYKKKQKRRKTVLVNGQAREIDCDVLVDNYGNEIQGQIFDEYGRCVNEQEVVSRAVDAGVIAPSDVQPAQGYENAQPYGSGDYGAQQQQGYGTPQGYGAQPGYGTPDQSYGSPYNQNQGYGSPYQHTPPTYDQGYGSAPAYGAPAPGYNAGYTASPSHYPSGDAYGAPGYPPQNQGGYGGYPSY